MEDQLNSDLKNWIKKNESKKIQKGNLWYWTYSPDHTKPVDFKFDQKIEDDDT